MQPHTPLVQACKVVDATTTARCMLHPQPIRGAVHNHAGHTNVVCGWCVVCRRAERVRVPGVGLAWGVAM